MALNKCCCCVNLRTGAIVIAILGILGSFGQLHDKEHIYIGIISDVVGVLANLFLLHGAIKYNKTTTLVYLIFEAIFIIGYIVGMCLVIAALVDKQFKLGWDGTWDFPVVWNTEDLKILDGKIEDVGTCAVVVGYLTATLVVIIIRIALVIYFWVCVYSFFGDFKKQGLPQLA